MENKTHKLPPLTPLIPLIKGATFDPAPPFDQLEILEFISNESDITQFWGDMEAEGGFNCEVSSISRTEMEGVFEFSFYFGDLINYFVQLCNGQEIMAYYLVCVDNECVELNSNNEVSINNFTHLIENLSILNETVDICGLKIPIVEPMWYYEEDFIRNEIFNFGGQVAFFIPELIKKIYIHDISCFDWLEHQFRKIHKILANNVDVRIIRIFLFLILNKPQNFEVIESYFVSKRDLDVLMHQWLNWRNATT